jgi:hypothetical protein
MTHQNAHISESLQLHSGGSDGREMGRRSSRYRLPPRATLNLRVHLPCLSSFRSSDTRIITLTSPLAEASGVSLICPLVTLYIQDPAPCLAHPHTSPFNIVKVLLKVHL